MVSKQPGKLWKGVLFLQDNTSSHVATITQRKFTDLHSEVLTHPAHSSDLVTSDYHLFPNFKNIWTGWNFQSLWVPCLLQATSLQPNLQHSIWMIYRSCSSGVRSVMNSGESMLNEVFVSNGSLSLLQSQRLISNPPYPLY